ncbi:MAG: RNA polymerase sigma-70 factor [Bacteroidetes bacterium]|nr:RNA polymerase sigma-70 factor [Bacteroidota bacterium]
MSTTPVNILPNEIELFALMSKDDQAAFTKIFDHYEPRIYPFVLKMTRSQVAAEEIVQELFINLWTSRALAMQIGNPRSYLFRMAVNRTLRYMQKSSRHAILVQKASGRMTVEKNVTEEMIDLKETEELINKAVEQLPTQQKKIYLLSRRQGLNNEQIAEQLNISKSTVKNHLTEALHSIKQKLQSSPGTTIALVIFLVKNAH